MPHFLILLLLDAEVRVAPNVRPVLSHTVMVMYSARCAHITELEEMGRFPNVRRAKVERYAWVTHVYWMRNNRPYLSWHQEHWDTEIRRAELILEYWDLMALDCNTPCELHVKLKSIRKMIGAKAYVDGWHPPFIVGSVRNVVDTGNGIVGFDE